VLVLSGFLEHMQLDGLLRARLAMPPTSMEGTSDSVVLLSAIGLGIVCLHLFPAALFALVLYDSCPGRACRPLLGGQAPIGGMLTPYLPFRCA
jgi:hypothetical protein